MARAEQTKLLVTSGLDRLRPLLKMLRELRWPGPIQRFTRRGVERLLARIPELGQLLDKRPRRTASVQPASRTVDLPELLSELTARDYQTRVQAAQALASRAEPEAVSALTAALRDRSVEVAVASATALSIGGSEQARAALLSVLENVDGFYHPLARAAAVHGLGALLESDEQRAPVYRALRDLDAEVSIAAISALSTSGSEEAATRLLEVLENRDGYFVALTRLAAARALERLPPVDSSRLEWLLGTESDPGVAASVRRLLEHAPPIN